MTHYGGLTRAEAYRSGLAALREGLGTEAFLLGCGAPLQHAAGTLHAKSVNLDGRPYAVTIAIPRGMRVRTCKSDVACTVKPLESGGGHCVVEWPAGTTADLEWSVTFGSSARR